MALALDKLEQMIKLLETNVSKEDFVNNFEKVAKLVLETKKQMERAIISLEMTYQAMMQKMEREHGEAMGRMDDTMKQHMADMEKKHEGKMDKMTGKMEQAMASWGQERQEMKKDMVAERQVTRDVLKEFSQSIAEQVDIKVKEKDEAFEEVKKELVRVQEILSNIPRGGKAMGRAKVQIIRSINLTSQVNGATSAFVLDPDVVNVLGVFGTQFPVNFNAGTDWTFAGRTLTLDTAQVGIPQTGQTLWALCDVLFYP